MGTERFGRTRLDEGFAKAKANNVGIESGAHPEFDQPTPLDKAVEWVKQLGHMGKRGLSKTGSPLSPTTTKDH